LTISEHINCKICTIYIFGSRNLIGPETGGNRQFKALSYSCLSSYRARNCTILKNDGSRKDFIYKNGFIGRHQILPSNPSLRWMLTCFPSQVLALLCSLSTAFSWIRRWSCRYCIVYFGLGRWGGVTMFAIVHVDVFEACSFCQMLPPFPLLNPIFLANLQKYLFCLTVYILSFLVSPFHSRGIINCLLILSGHLEETY
jgi:hypothetical protein